MSQHIRRSHRRRQQPVTAGHSRRPATRAGGPFACSRLPVHYRSSPSNQPSERDPPVATPKKTPSCSATLGERPRTLHWNTIDGGTVGRRWRRSSRGGQRHPAAVGPRGIALPGHAPRAEERREWEMAICGWLGDGLAEYWAVERIGETQGSVIRCETDLIFARYY